MGDRIVNTRIQHFTTWAPIAIVSSYLSILGRLLPAKWRDFDHRGIHNIWVCCPSLRSCQQHASFFKAGDKKSKFSEIGKKLKTFPKAIQGVA